MRKLYILLFLFYLLPVVVNSSTVNINGIYYNVIINATEQVAEVTENPRKYKGDVVIPTHIYYGGLICNVTSIGYRAFSGCANLTSVTIGNNVTTIGKYAFYGCNSLTSIVIPGLLKKIEESAFQNCSGLTSLRIGQELEDIGDHAFSGCNSLNHIVVNGANEKYDSREDCNAIIETKTNSLIVGCKNSVLPNSVTSIGNYAFYNCSSLSSVTIPNSVTSIGEEAFLGCSGLSSVTIGNSVMSIGNYAFFNCSGLTSVTIPNSVTSIGEWAFSGCSGLTSVIISNSVTRIEDGVFKDCSSLTSVAIPNSVTRIGYWAFSRCKGIATITIPNNVTSIGYCAFYYCSELKLLTIGSNVKNIEDEAFAGCNELMTVYCLARKVPNTGNNSFRESDISNTILYVPADVLDAYKDNSPWNQFRSIVALEDDTPIGDKKCAPPTIRYENGELTFNCTTEDVEYVYEITNDDVRNDNGSETKVCGIYKVAVYAIKEGYEDSEIVTASLIWSDSGLKAEGLTIAATKDKRGDVNNDGTVDVADIVTIISAMASKSREGGTE